MALRVGPIPQKCNVSNHGIAPVTARVRISQNVDILAKVYPVHLKVEHCRTLCVVSYIYRSK